MDKTLAGTKLQIDKPETDVLRTKLSGNWKMGNELPSVSEIRRAIETDPGVKRLEFASQELIEWDTGLLAFLRKVADLCAQNDVTLDDTGLPEGIRGLFRLATATPVKETPRDPLESSLLARIGDTAIRWTKTETETLTFVGEIFYSALKWLRRKEHFRRFDLLVLLQDTGVFALPIVMFINFLLGAVLAFIGALQLHLLGADIFLANLVAIPMVREISPLMTAIVFAGRSGASFAAELGIMTVNEEIDALRTMGISPMVFLVLPRLLALILMTPLLVLFGDFMGIIGGAVVSKIGYGLSLTLYFNQVTTLLSGADFLVGLIKAAVYGGLVAFAGCMAGLNSGRSASSVGDAISRSVVMMIVFIVSAMAITTVIFSLIGI